MPGNFHSAIVKPLSSFQKDSIKTINLPKSPGGKGGVQIIIGRLKGATSTTTHSYHFPMSKYTVAEAKAWLKKNKIEYIEFEKATGGVQEIMTNILQTEPPISANRHGRQTNTSESTVGRKPTARDLR